MHPKFKFEKEIEEKVKIIVAIVTKITKCRHKTECSDYKCEFKHETKSGLSKKAEKIMNIWKEIVEARGKELVI